MVKPVSIGSIFAGDTTGSPAALSCGKDRSRLREPRSASDFPEVDFGTERPFPARFAAALNRRLRPVGPLPREDFRQAIGISMRQLVESWLTGRVDALGSGVDRAIAFFAAQPDGLSFLAELFDLPPLIWLSAHRAAMARVRAVMADDFIEDQEVLAPVAARLRAKASRR